jgi:hypothetical protein
MLIVVLPVTGGRRRAIGAVIDRGVRRRDHSSGHAPRSIDGGRPGLAIGGA